MTVDSIALQGVGMTSRRARERLVAELRQLGIRSDAVCQVMLETPRHIFVDEAMAHRAYQNVALPIGYQQTISQPYIVARMTELAVAARRPGKALEIGTGCGYQTAVLARLADAVYTVERIEPLQRQARSRLARLGLRNVRYRLGDGAEGWPDIDAFDAIVVTAAAAEPPSALLAQLGENACMVVPVGDGATQQLKTVHRRNGRQVTESVATVRFVPLVSGPTMR